MCKFAKLEFAPDDMATIGIYDSGVGGLSVLREILKVLPDEKYVYFADNAYCPYGDKDVDFIVERAREISDYLIFKGADVIVIACNTATAAAVSALREEYSSDNARLRTLTSGRLNHIRFIGMEPAIKPAALGTRSGVVGVLATAGTISSEKYLLHKEEFDNVRIVEQVGEGFVELVERGCLSGPEAEALVRRSVDPLIQAGADKIVLGCTHYPFLKELIQKSAGPDVELIDPSPAIARQLLRVIKEEGIALEERKLSDPDVLLKSSGSIEALNNMYSQLFK